MKFLNGEITQKFFLDIRIALGFVSLLLVDFSLILFSEGRSVILIIVILVVAAVWGYAWILMTKVVRYLDKKSKVKKRRKYLLLKELEKELNSDLSGTSLKKLEDSINLKKNTAKLVVNKKRLNVVLVVPMLVLILSTWFLGYQQERETQDFIQKTLKSNKETLEEIYTTLADKPQEINNIKKIAEKNSKSIEKVPKEFNAIKKIAEKNSKSIEKILKEFNAIKHNASPTLPNK